MMKTIVFTLCLTGAACLATAQPAESTETIRFGIIGTDTSHAIQFAKIFNSPSEKNHVSGGRVTHAFKGGSPDIPSSADRIEKFTADLQSSYSVTMVDTIEELVKNVDVVLLESVDGRKHLEQVKPVFAARKPVFIDKPFAGSLKDAIEIARLAKESGTPCWSSSSLRYYPAITDLKDASKVGSIVSATAYSPSTLDPTHPDLFWYGIHGVETLFTLMGTGCLSVSRTAAANSDVAVGTWSDGRTGTFYGMRDGKSGYGALAFGTKSIQHAEYKSGDLYGPLAQEIMKFAQTKTPPVSLDTTVEIMAFMEAADESKRQGGKPVSLKEVLDKASN